MHTLHTFLVSAISFVIALGILVLVHEFGHFLAAKLCGVRVEQFSIGFPPRLFGIKIGDTDYCVSATPLGGYVKMTGESMPGENLSLAGADGATIEAQKLDPGALTSHPRWQRIIIGLAGPFANFVLALVLMTGFYMLHNEVPLYEDQPIQLDWVLPGSTAADAGFKPGDIIANFDGQEKPTWEQVEQHALLNLSSVNISHSLPVVVSRVGQRIPLTLPLVIKPAATQDSSGKPSDANAVPDVAGFTLEKLGLLPVFQPGPTTVNSVNPDSPASKAGIQKGDALISLDGHAFHSLEAIIPYLQAQKGAPLTVVLDHAGQQSTVVVQPVYDTANPPSAWRIGFKVDPPPYRIEQLPLPKAFAASVQFNRDSSTLILEVLKRLLTRRMSVSTLSGPIGIAQQTGMAAETPGWEAKFKTLTAISVNLGILNLMPFPILDGGMILFLLIESVMRRDVNIEVKERIYQVAFVLIIVFFAYIMFNDISKLGMFTHFKS
jgi:regulator of sigma E protease